MSIELLSINHKYTPIEVRSHFAFDEEQQVQMMMRLMESPLIEECIVLSTCNRTEVYLYSQPDSHANTVLEYVQRTLLEEADAQDVPDIGDYIRLYQGKKAIHHIFQVAAGLDSMVVGEDQILGQVKRAHSLAQEHKVCGTFLNTLFRYAVTGAKRVKTDTRLSKTPVSTASLSIRMAEELLGGLAHKKVLIIGASGKIGSIVFRNLQSMEDVHVSITTRNHVMPHRIKHNPFYHTIPYENRYEYLKEMDVIISATKSPHYTLTYHHVKPEIGDGKERVFIDLAVPMDIESKISRLDGVHYINIDALKKIADENNQKKLKEAKAADTILVDYELQFERWLLFQNALPTMRQVKAKFLGEADEKGIDKAMNQLFYGIREQSAPEELDVFLKALEHYIGE